MQPGPATHWLWVRCAGFGASTFQRAHYLAGTALHGGGRDVSAGAPLTGLGVSWHLLPCRGSLHFVRVSGVCGDRGGLLFDTCPCALVAAGSVPLWRASVYRAAAPRPVRSGRSLCSGRLSCFCGAFSYLGPLARIYWAAVLGMWRPAEKRAHGACGWPPPRRRRLARSASYLFAAPQGSYSWRVPPASVLGCMRYSGLDCVDLVTHASAFPCVPPSC